MATWFRPAPGYMGLTLGETFMTDRATSRDALIFAMPFLQAAGLERLEKATALALTCWNIGLLPEAERAKARQEMTTLFSFAASWFPESADGFAELEQWVDRLIRRKIEQFGHIDRVIVEHQVSTNGSDVTLTTGTAGPGDHDWRLN